MKPEFNKAIMFQIVDEIGRATSCSGKSRDEIINILTLQHPEIICSEDDWNEMNQETQENIVRRIKETITSL